MTYELIQHNGKYNIHYTGGEFDGLIEFHSLDGINGKVRDGYTNVNAPNWLGLEQQLRYSNEFSKAFATSSDKGFNLFTTTLVNGKLGHSSENGLAFAFSVIGVDWTEQEKENINAVLEANNFTYRLV